MITWFSAAISVRAKDTTFIMAPAPYHAQINVSDHPRGKGYFKFNSPMLETENFIFNVTNIVEETSDKV